jgi:tyrosine-protein phosphatase YwqE
VDDKQPQVIEEHKEASTDDQVKATSNSMIEVLSKSDNPKHRNSKFLKFLKKLSTGAYSIENEQLVKNPEKLVEFKGIEEQRL